MPENVSSERKAVDGIITESRLYELTGLKQRAALRKHLRRAGIPFRVVNGRILTTEEAFTATLVGRAKAKKGPDLAALTTEREG